MKILLHTCCAPCSVYCIDRLRQLNIDMDVYWYNPNIHPYLEYKQRRDCLKEYAKSINVNAVFEDEYGLDEFCKNVVYDLKNRCMNYCYKVRLEKTAEYAKKNNYDAFSTTLLVSPYQNHEGIKQIAEEVAKKYEIQFWYEDFRVGFHQGQNKARELGLYMQKYCGCVFSTTPANMTQEINKPKLPEGFEFLPVERSINIKKEKVNKEKYRDLLFETDPNKKIIDSYLRDGDLFVLTYKHEVACIAVVLEIDKDIVELKNMVTKNQYIGQDLEGNLLKYLADNYKTQYKKMIVGTSENKIPFYVKHGFDQYEKTIKNYFVDNYGREIIDGETRCIDIYYYSKKLK